MSAIAKHLVRHRRLYFLLTCAAALFMGILFLRVPLITDMTRYLPDDSAMKAGVDIMAEEFSGLSLSNTIRVMFTDVPEEEKPKLLEEISGIEYVDSVSYTAGDPHFEKDGHTLFKLNFGYDYGSPEVSAIEAELRSQFSGLYEMTYSVDDTTGGKVPVILMVLAVIMIIAILTFMSSSWIEPYLYLLAIGLAVLINMGSNYFLGGISDITMSIAAILQLVLSMDYSIILMNRYRQELGHHQSPTQAMEAAIASSFSSISSSSLTTVVGLLALLFMGFKIGGEMGGVLAKGVLISMICIMTAMPALILSCTRLLEKTAKRSPRFSLQHLAQFEVRFRYPILAAFILMFVVMFVLKGNTDITFTLSEPNQIDAIFPKTNQIVVLYDNEDDEAAARLCDLLAEEDCVEQVNAYVNTLGAPLLADELASSLPQLMGSMSSYGGSAEDGFPADLGAVEFDADTMDAARMLIHLLYYEYGLGSEVSLSSEGPENAEISERSEGSENAETSERSEGSGRLTEPDNMADLRMSLTVSELLDTASKDILGNPLFAGFASEEQLNQAKVALSALRPILSGLFGERQLDEEAFCTQAASFFPAEDEQMPRLLFRLAAAQNSPMEQVRHTIRELVDFAASDLCRSPLYSPYLQGEGEKMLSQIQQIMQELTSSLRSEKHSIIAIFADLEDSGSEAFAFMDHLKELCSNEFSKDVSLIGNTALAWETSKTFRQEMNKITLITAAAIFVVVLLTFRNVLIPIVLVLLIQTSVFATMVVIDLQGDGIYYLALLMVQSILMGATIDYAILLTNYYREYRKKEDVLSSLVYAYRGSIHTILSSGLIIVLITVILGYAFPNPTIGQICHTIAKGAFAALVLIMLILPGTLAALDRFIVRADSHQAS